VSSHEHRSAARRAGLTYVTDGLAGITRKRSGTGWAYYTPDGSRIADVCLHEAGGLVHVPAPSARQVVEHPDVVSALHERVHEVRADEAGSACYEGVHSALS